MTNNEILKIAMVQSAIDCNCAPEDFCGSDNKVVISKGHPLARKYLELPHFCNLVSYGNNIVATVDERVKNFVFDYINRFKIYHCFQTPNLYLLDSEFSKYGMQNCFMAEFFLPDMNILAPLKCQYKTKILFPDDLTDLYTGEWSSALSDENRSLDIMAMGAYDGDKLIGLAGCSADCDTMWQIGINVLPSYRKHGIAAALVSNLALEILKCGKVPFYCCAWSNIGSSRTAISSGLRPAWVELTAKGKSFIDKLLSE